MCFQDFYFTSFKVKSSFKKVIYLFIYSTKNLRGTRTLPLNRTEFEYSILIILIKSNKSKLINLTSIPEVRTKIKVK